MELKDYLVEALHTFQVHTLKAFNYQTRVTLVNLSNQQPEYETSYHVDVRVNFPDGTQLVSRNVSFIEIGARVTLECADYLNKQFDGEAILTFSMIPIRYRDNLVVTTTRAELWFLLTAQDHHVEYYRDDGFSSGVLYQSGAFNYGGFSKERNTIVQAPKIYRNSEIDTFMSFIYNGFDESSKAPAELQCVLVSGAERVAEWTELIQPKTVKLVEVSSRIPKSDESKFACLYALCSNATLLPLTISRNKKSNCIAIEHSLPPNYYGASITGGNRKRVVADLVKSVFKSSDVR